MASPIENAAPNLPLGIRNNAPESLGGIVLTPTRAAVAPNFSTPAADDSTIPVSSSAGFKHTSPLLVGQPACAKPGVSESPVVETRHARETRMLNELMIDEVSSEPWSPTPSPAPKAWTPSAPSD